MVLVGIVCLFLAVLGVILMAAGKPYAGVMFLLAAIAIGALAAGVQIGQETK
jgi:hypothetical protein